MVVLTLLPEDGSANVETCGALFTTLNMNLEQKYAQKPVCLYLEFEFVVKTVAIVGKCPYLGRRAALGGIRKRGSNMPRVILCKVSGVEGLARGRRRERGERG